MGTPAKVLGPSELRRLSSHVTRGRYALRNKAIVALSFKAGLRACEIAGLDWTMVLSPNGQVADLLHIGDGIAKNGQGRRLPTHPELRVVLRELHRAQDKPTHGPVIRSQKGGRLTPRSVVNWFARQYGELGLAGCSSHSGRRTFITQAARIVSRAGASLRDVQILVGHRDLATTQLYIDGDTAAQRKLVAML